VTETYPPEINGVAMTLAQLVGGLRGRGHRVSLVRPRRPAEQRREGGDETLVPGMPLPGYREARIGLPARALLRSRWARDLPDVVYVATEGPLGWSAVRAAHRLRIPALSGFHTDFPSYARHYHVGWLARLALAYLRRLHNASCGTVVASEDLRDRLRSLGFKNLSVLGRGVDSDLFSPDRRSVPLRRSWGAGQGDVVLLYVGRLAPEKNLPLAIEAYRAIQRARRGVRFAVVGGGPLRAVLEGAHPDLHFCGVQTGRQLAEHYASADLFVLPSETETFGNVILEAMASGLPVAAFDRAAARCHVRDGETGALVPAGQRAPFIAAAVALAHSSEQLTAMGRRARAHAAQLDWRSVVDRFESLLWQALAGDPATRPATTQGGLRGQKSRRALDTRPPRGGVTC
jgi:glycosyltransferase involved in cell wall biosynthesis